MNNATQLQEQFEDQFQTLQDMVADESFGMRKDQFESLKEKIYDPKVNEKATEEELDLIIEIGRERHFYLDDGRKWFDLVKKAEELISEAVR